MIDGTLFGWYDMPSYSQAKGSRMTTALAVPRISISPAFKASINCDSYHCIEGSPDENVLAALFVSGARLNVEVSAPEFLDAYLHLVEALFRGVWIDFRNQPHLAGTRLFIDARAMKGRHTPELLQQEAILTVGNFVSEGNGAFVASLHKAIAHEDIRLAALGFLAQ